MATLLPAILFLLVSGLIIPHALTALKSGQLRVRGGAVVKKEDRAFVFWASVSMEAIIGVCLFVGGVSGIQAAIAAR